MISLAEKSLDELASGDGIGLEHLVERGALSEMVQSFYDLFLVPLRMFGREGQLLADASEEPALHAYLRGSSAGQDALEKVARELMRSEPMTDTGQSHACVTGRYRVLGVDYDGRRIGKMIIGPFLPPGVAVSNEILALDAGFDAARVEQLMAQMPRAREETISQIAEHLKKTLDLILFSGHRALLTSNMHLATVSESYRELQDKNARLQEAYDRLKELDRLKSNFLATVSHELRTPLTSIIGYSEMLAEGIAGELSGEQCEFVRTIYEKGEQLLELIKGLLDLSKLESGTLSLRKDAMDAEPLVRDVSQTVTPSALKRGVQILVEVEEGLPELWADKERIRQVLLNLVENAIKFTPAGGKVTLCARLSSMEATPPEDDAGLVLLNTPRVAIEFRVEDTGIGIPESERHRVFDAFYQVDSSSTREQGGTGLGLSIVKRLVDGHDGLVRIEDNQPKGAVFVVTIPCRRATLA